MTRQVPAPLQAHLNEAATTTTRLLKITLTNGFVYGLSMLDADVIYDDGQGPITYIATNGFDSSTISADIGYTVDNAEGYALISQDINGLELADIEAGVLDDAQWVCYLVNFRDITQGHMIIDAGDVGEVRTKYGLVWLPELLSYMARLRQPVGSTWSRTCRAVFGSPAPSQTGCGISLVPLWVSGTVLSVGAEDNRIFTGDDVGGASPAIPPVPGRVQFLTGLNAGREFAVEELDGLTVSLAEPTNYAMAPGDTYRIRPDCAKRYDADCIGKWNNGPNFKGEPLIPVGDAGGLQSPGAELGKGAGYIGGG